MQERKCRLGAWKAAGVDLPMWAFNLSLYTIRKDGWLECSVHICEGKEKAMSNKRIAFLSTGTGLRMGKFALQNKYLTFYLTYMKALGRVYCLGGEQLLNFAFWMTVPRLACV